MEKGFLKQLLLTTGVLLAAVSVLSAQETPASPVPWKTSEYTLLAREMPIREALTTFGTSQGISVVMSKSVAGVFSGDFKKIAPQKFLEDVAMLNNLTWYYDGAALYIYSSSEIETLLLDLKYMKAEEVRTILRQLEVEDRRFPLKTASDDELIIVAGPPRYVMLVAELVEKADKLREKRAFSEIETRIFYLKHTWADDVSFAASAGDGAQIKGVANLLQDIMLQSNVRTKDKELKNAENGDAAEKTKEDRLTDMLDRGFQPIIKAENRLNAVIVRDAVSKMPLYERLIAELDVPQKLVEIAVTSLELTKDDALDWQLSLSVKGSHGNAEGAAGQSPANLFSPENLIGKGLAGAMSYIGKNVTVSASLSALRQKGKARSISRTSLLTTNNMAASISDTQSYHARVVGSEVASLEEVSAGTTLSVKPRIVLSDDDKPDQLWMTISLSDGGFEAMSVDAMPVTRKSSLETQAAVFEGDCILLAGYFRDIEENVSWGIPYLRDIPYIGWLFGGIGKKTETVQRLFILTPYVIDLYEDGLARLQASRQRDITREEELENDKKEDDAQREIRDLERKDRDDARRLKNDETLEKRKGELKLKQDMRKAESKKNLDAWRKDIGERREEWEKTLEAEQKETEK